MRKKLPRRHKVSRGNAAVCRRSQDANALAIWPAMVCQIPGPLSGGAVKSRSPDCIWSHGAAQSRGMNPRGAKIWQTSYISGVREQRTPIRFITSNRCERPAPQLRVGAGDAIAIKLTEEITDDVKTLEEHDPRGDPNRRLVMDWLNAVVRQTGVRDERSERLHLLPCDGRCNRTKQRWQVLCGTRSFARRLHGRQINKSSPETWGSDSKHAR